MKIKAWSELNVSNTEYHAWFEDGDIVIRDIINGQAVIIDCAFDNYRITGILKFFGFDIEFIEAPKLTEQGWHFVRAFEYGWIARDKINWIYFYQSKPRKYQYEWHHDGEMIRLRVDMFPHIQWTDDEPWSIADLRKLDKEV